MLVKGSPKDAAAGRPQQANISQTGSWHRRRVETRRSDIEGLVLPTWDEVVGRHYVPWNEPRWIIDTAVMSAEEAVQAIGARMTE